MPSPLARAEALALRGLMSLPPPLMRRLAGPPVVVDGLTLDLEIQWLLRLRDLTGEAVLETLPIPDGRREVRRQGRLSGGSQPIGAVRDLQVAGATGPLPARLYVPRAQLDSTAPAPMLVFFHGGGMIYGDLDSHDPTCRLLAERAGVRVLAIDYRLAPEQPFPAAIDDAWASYSWIAEHARDLGADPDRLAVGGDSAGGLLSAMVAVEAARVGVPLRFQLLVYPATNMAEPSRSRELFADGFFLTRAFIELANESYIPSADRWDPRVSVQFTDPIPDGLAPALVVTAGFDPLRDEGEAYAATLAAAGVEVEQVRHDGLIHSFFNIVGVGRSSRRAVEEMADRLAAALG